MSNPDIGPWVNPEVQEKAPWKTQSGIVKFFEFVVPIKGMSERAFHIYWQKHHSPNVMNITVFAQFMRKYNSSHRYLAPVQGVPARYKVGGPLIGAAEVWLNSVQQVGEWLGLPEYENLIAPDEPRFLSEDGEIEFIIAKEERLFETDPDMPENGLTKVYLLTRRKSGSDRDSFHQAASDLGRHLISKPNLSRHLKKFVISHKLIDPLPLEGFEPSDIDAIFELWFEDVRAMARFFAEPEYTSEVMSKESEVFDIDSMRAMVVKMRVVHDEFSFQPSTTQPMPFNWE